MTQTTTAADTCQHRSGCTAPREVGLATDYADFEFCQAHATQVLDALNPNRTPGGPRAFTL